jgi:hypothetical protein
MFDEPPAGFHNRCCRLVSEDRSKPWPLCEWRSRPSALPETRTRSAMFLTVLRAEILVAERQLGPNFIVNLSGDADAAGVGETLQPRVMS